MYIFGLFAKMKVSETKFSLVSLVVPVLTVPWKKIVIFAKNHKFRNLFVSKIAKVAKISIFAISQITQSVFKTIYNPDSHSILVKREKYNSRS